MPEPDLKLNQSTDPDSPDPGLGYKSGFMGIHPIWTRSLFFNFEMVTRSQFGIQSGDYLNLYYYNLITLYTDPDPDPGSMGLHGNQLASRASAHW